MGYETMAAWDRFQTFQFNDEISKRGGIWDETIDVRSKEGYTISRGDYSTPTSPTGAFAPSFQNATSTWSPSQSPLAMSVRGSPNNSPPQSPSVDSAYPFSASIPETPSTRERNLFADKIYAAACAGDLDHIKLLLSLGAPIEASTLVEGLYEIFKPAKSGRLSPLAGAAGHGHLHVVKFLLAQGARLNPDVIQSSNAPLHEACRNNNLEITRYLLSVGADIDQNNCYNSTSLMYAVRYGSPALVSLLLSYKPKLRQSSFIGTAAIHMCTFSGRADVLELLLQAGADVNHRMLSGSTPLHCAATVGRTHVVECLLRYGADPKKKDQDEKTPGEVAGESGHAEIGEILRVAMSRRR